MQITVALKSDLPQILALQKKCYLKEAALYQDFNIPPLTQTLDSLEEDFNNQLFLKVTDGNSLVASVRGAIKEGACHIERLFVDVNYQNRGLAKQLISTMESRFMQAERYVLCSGHKSFNTLALYTKLGYAEFKREVFRNELQFVYMQKFSECARLNAVAAA